ncbi:MAG: hypothetical protein A3H45_06025 [Ignavibacteria bacterium RIFCSPLOWO2_02_FULL_55_14]|nr:MAG: hypothetical protein A3H45_06025 [Ignavibacteria bacterium RIFCSPLOWO2_02_FULL_55_14]
MKETEFVIQLGPADRLREYHARSRGKIINFSVQYETLWRGDWLPVVRYDTAHGFSHRDQYGIQGTVIKTPLFILDYNRALTFAELDLKANWQLYRERFFRRVG